ncbi:hypothetical protein GGI04_000446 [Coemansia thaxteri]|uniref:Uncharacterized protein n=1 Tax=Coemansia thaxteri TaxID=2663907 RepID=A0A9W8BMY9_9FUNG|nr:hypothetical protein H4R26_001440 [Coemansia thaxteri]KAJ2009474.1 hypothetical protein GGI04_000446 [Coemansia thaxteri]KAJ2473299.1 hypothetical protein GGI02_000969 [Coemansia sp. RSA 2322]KAJ2484061.1 hypothetical protein EV174_002738 [Coemansia sp. RSA 2320]
MALILKNHALRMLLLLCACGPAVVAAQAPSGSGFRSLRRRHGAHSDHEARDELDCTASGVDDWNTKLHIGAVFIVLVVSGIGSFLPVLGYYVKRLHIPKMALTLGKFLGTGVIISTALIHMLPDGAEALGSPCIGGRMGSYGGWPGLLAILAILAMHMLEFLLSAHAMGQHSHSHAMDQHSHSHAMDQHGPSHATPGQLEDQQHGPAAQQSEGLSESSSAVAKPSFSPDCDAVAVHTHHTHVHGLSFIDEGRATHASTYILELGICLHSVIIGVTLSVTTGTGFTTLLVAICFHQLCEGLALGSRLAQMQYKKNAFLRASISAAVFMLITPIGMLIGIGVRYSYQPNSPAALISMGVLDSLSAGILLYTGLVNLLAEEFGSLEFRSFGLSKKALCFIATYIGAGIMALIGNWA